MCVLATFLTIKMRKDFEKIGGGGGSAARLTPLFATFKSQFKIVE
jgi:hypothetical protein